MRAISNGSNSCSGPGKSGGATIVPGRTNAARGARCARSQTFEMDVKAIYTSCACNRNPQALDWGYNNIICYAACNAVVLYDPQVLGIGFGPCSTRIIKSLANFSNVFLSDCHP